MGRRTKLTADRQEKIVKALIVGATYEVAARRVGITDRTLRNWLERGRAERKRLEEPYARKRKREAPYVELLDAVEQAEAEYEVMALATIVSSGARGHMWILSRRHPDRWGKKRETELSGEVVLRFEHEHSPPRDAEGHELSS